MTPRFPSTAYGLRLVAADAPSSAEGHAVRVHAGGPATPGRILPWHAPAPGGARIDRVPDLPGLRLRYDDGTVFVLDDAGRDLWIDAPPDVSATDVETYLNGPVLALVLRLRGITALHASAVRIAGGAALFTGPAGMGKSTLAAAFAAAGYALIADDAAALLPRGAAWGVPPGPAALRLWTDAADALGLGTLPPLTPGWDKRRLGVDEGAAWAEAEVPLRAVYLLERAGAGSPPRSDALTPRDALLALIPNVLGANLPSPAWRARDLTTLAAVVRTVPVQRLHVPEAWSALAPTRDLVAAEMRLPSR